MSTGAGINVQQRLEVLIQDFRSSEPPMPVVVLHAEDGAADDRVTELVDELYTGQDAHGTRCAVAEDPQDGRTEVRRAARLVRELGDPKRWEGRHSIYRSYAFPRLRLVRAIEDAAGELGANWPQGLSTAGTAGRTRDPAQQLLDQLAKQRWRPKDSTRWSSGLSLFNMAHIFPASVVAVLAALLANSPWHVALASGVGFLLLLVLLDYVLPGRGPIFLWLRRESRWFMTTTFLRAAARGRPTDVSLLRPVRSWKAIAARAYDVAEALKEGDQFQLQLYVLALLEDLRDNHRRWSWDLRGLKRPRPPMLFLPHIGAENGGIELIKAVSDVRSRRSELDPLLIVAAVRAADVQRLQRSVVQGPGGTLWIWYQEWVRNLRAGQSPSRELAELPWVLKIPLPGGQLRPLEDGQQHCTKAATRPTVARLVWAVHTLAVVVALVAAAVVARADGLRGQYCSASVLTANRDTERKPALGGRTECIGIATGDVRFADWLADDERASDEDETPWTLAELEQRIRKQNKDIVDKRAKHVTVVYAGPLSADPDGGSSPVKGIEELAGVYLAQAVINDNHSVRLRVLIANGGVDLHSQEDMADAIAKYAAEDQTVVGVVGTGRDLKSSEVTTRRLRDAGLPVVSGTNSATYLPRDFANWFSLAAPDEWQVDQLGLIARQLRTQGKKQHALVLARDTRNTDDLYTSEQAKYGQRMLKEQGFTTLRQRRYTLSGGRPELRVPAEEICGGEDVPSVIYFAGRVEDIDPLMVELGTQRGCTQQEMSILTGDDLSKADFSPGKDRVAPNVTLYYAALAALEKAEQRGTAFYEDAREHLPGLGTPRPSFSTAAFASGQTALAHDATRALYRAATRKGVPQSRTATWANLRTVDLEGMATGRIDFTGAPLYKVRSGHSILLEEVRRTDDGTYRRRDVCSRVAGDTEPLTAEECAIDQGG